MTRDATAVIADLLEDDGARPLAIDDALAVVGHLHTEVDRGTRAREQAARRAGITIACGRGCNRCCVELLLVHEGEALAVARWLGRPENAAVRDAFLAAYPRWRERVGDAPERLTELAAAGDQRAFDAAHQAQMRAGVLCAFNDAEGGCSIHAIRPVACRNGHAVDTPDYCGADHPSGKPAVRLAFVPLDDFLARVRGLDQSLHRALGRPDRRPEALCVAVHRLLTSPGPKAPA